MKGSFGKLQKVGKALMMPVAVLPVAGLLLRLGVLWNIGPMTAAGAAIFDNLPLLFAIGVAIGLAKGNHGAAGLAGVVAYLTMTTVASSINEAVDMKVFAGIIAGVVAGNLYNKYKDIKLPDWLGFFGGKRFVPIISALVAMAIGGAAGFVWPPIQGVIDGAGNWMIESGPIGLFSYGTLNRLLIPVGLHHILNNIVFFIFGEFNGATGDLGRFFAGDPNAGAFMAGFFPVMMFGLPGAALAIYKAARKENRAAVGGMLFSVAFTAFLTGITEPIEFMFMFLAPALYVVHALLTGISFLVTYFMGILHGFTFSAGFIDYAINYGLATKPIMLLPVGAIFFGIYYAVFYFSIVKFDIKTPGRYDDEEGDLDDTYSDLGDKELANEFISALGGRANIQEVDSCITRLRLRLVDTSEIDEVKLQKLGSAGILKPNKTSAQVVLGTKAELVAESIKKAL